MRSSRAWIISALVVALAFTGFSCSKDGVGPLDAPSTPTITNPSDGSSLNSASINVIGRAPSYSTVEVYLDGVATGAKAVSAGGRFTIEDVELGADQSFKDLQAKAVDLYGKSSPMSDTVTIFLDLVRPNYVLEYISGADVPDPPPGMTPDSLDWETLEGSATIVGLTELGSEIRVWESWGSALPELLYADSTRGIDTNGDAIADSLRFWKTVQLLQGQNYYLVEVEDAAENVTRDTLTISNVEETECRMLRYDTDVYNNGDAFDAEVTGQPEMELAVLFEIPETIQGRYLSEVQIYIKDDRAGPPNTPSTSDFLLRVHDINSQGRPSGTPFFTQHIQQGYAEEAWLSVELSTETGPSLDLQGREEFAVTVYYMVRYNPVIGVDPDPLEIDGMSFRWNWSIWEPITSGDFGIRARVCTTRGEDKGVWLGPGR